MVNENVILVLDEMTGTGIAKLLFWPRFINPGCFLLE